MTLFLVFLAVIAFMVLVVLILGWIDYKYKVNPVTLKIIGWVIVNVTWVAFLIYAVRFIAGY